MVEPADVAEDLVPDAEIPHKQLPPLRYRDMPEPVPWKKMLGPSIILAGLSLGSGEFILWPSIVYKTGFVFFWACMLGVLTQFFLNMEIERWTLVTGESAITGFCRMSRHWAWIMLLLNVIPWAWPGWAAGAATIVSWVLFGAKEVVKDGEITYAAPYATEFAIAGLWLIGIVLTAGPVVYNTVERIQVVLVTIILVLAVLIAVVVVRPEAVVKMGTGIANVGVMPDLTQSGLSVVSLLGALAFAGAGGTTNLGQSNFIKDKGYGMGKYIGRITSPITGQEEAIHDVGFHFRHTPENLSRWSRWWRAANIEHFFSFFLTCVVCLCLMSLIAYSLFYDPAGNLKPGMNRFGKDMNFVWGEAALLGGLSWGPLLKYGFLIMGAAILLTTELGVLDTVARISTDIVKVNYLRESDVFSSSRLYYLFLWGEILLGTAILSVLGFKRPYLLISISAAMNGGVMFVYSLLLLYLNNKILSRSLSMGPVRFVVIVWSCAFFGYFSIQSLRLDVIPYFSNKEHPEQAAAAPRRFPEVDRPAERIGAAGVGTSGWKPAQGGRKVLRPLFQHFVKQRDAHHLVVANEDPLTVRPDTVALRFQNIQLARGVGVAKIVHVGVFKDQIAMIESDEGPHVDVRAGNVEDDLPVEKLIHSLGRFAHCPLSGNRLVRRN